MDLLRENTDIYAIHSPEIKPMVHRVSTRYRDWFIESIESSETKKNDVMYVYATCKYDHRRCDRLGYGHILVSNQYYSEKLTPNLNALVNYILIDKLRPACYCLFVYRLDVTVPLCNTNTGSDIGKIGRHEYFNNAIYHWFTDMTKFGHYQSVTAASTNSYMLVINIKEKIHVAFVSDSEFSLKAVSSFDEIFGFIERHEGSNLVLMNRELFKYYTTSMPTELNKLDYLLTAISTFTITDEQDRLINTSSEADCGAHVMNLMMDNINAYTKIKDALNVPIDVFKNGDIINETFRKYTDNLQIFANRFKAHPLNYYKKYHSKKHQAILLDAVHIDIVSMFPSFILSASNIVKYNDNLCKYPTFEAIKTCETKVGYVPVTNPSHLHLYYKHGGTFVTEFDIGHDKYVHKQIRHTIIFNEWTREVPYADIVRSLLSFKMGTDPCSKAIAKGLLVMMHGKIGSIHASFFYCHFLYAYTSAFMIDFTKNVNCMVIVDSITLSYPDYETLMLQYPYMFGNDVGQFKDSDGKCIAVINGINSYVLINTKKEIIKVRGKINVKKALARLKKYC